MQPGHNRSSILLCCSLTLVAVISVFWIGLLRPRAADTLPGRYTDAEFWRMVNDFSEPNGSYQYENFVSNEISYQNVISEMKARVKPGGVYLGVGPEQNFTYIAAIQPKVAFIIDIRRQNMLEQLIYKSLFEMASDRAEFVSLLFSRKRPEGLGVASSAQAILQAFESGKPDAELHAATLRSIKDRLIRQHGFKPIGDDEQKIDLIFDVFSRGGPRMNYAFASNSPNSGVPSFYNLMVVADERGQNWAFLGSEDRYQFVREMQQKNLIVPVVGDFAGPKALRAISQYLKEHAATVSVFYISNVEDYIETKWPAYVANIRSLPQDDSTLVVRFITASHNRTRMDERHS